MQEITQLLIKKKSSLLTKNLVPGKSVYGESLFQENSQEYRVWRPQCSKLAAAFIKGIDFSIKPDSVVLYLGASTGSSLSHLADLIPKGLVFGVDSAPRVMRELVFLAEQRANIVPILADARNPESYSARIAQPNIIYQDVAVRDQVNIFLKNVEFFLESGSIAVLCLKTRCIDCTKKPEVIAATAEQELKKGMHVLSSTCLTPFYKDHWVFVCKKEK